MIAEPVPEERIEQLLEAAIHAPSAENRQPWVFIVVREAAVRAQIAALVREVWTDGVREYTRQQLSPRFFAGVERWATTGLEAAPVIIIVCGDATLCPEVLLPSSIFPAVQNLLLAAQALGLGSLLSTLPVIAEERLRPILALPPHIKPLAAVPIGRPAQRLGPARRVHFSAKTFSDRYGNPWNRQ